MANRKIGALLVSVGADTKPLTEGLRDAEQKVSRFGRTSQRVGSRSRSSLSGMVGSAAGLARGAMFGAAAAGAGMLGAALTSGTGAGQYQTGFQLDRNVKNDQRMRRIRDAYDADPRLASGAYWTDLGNLFEEMKLGLSELKLSMMRGILDVSQIDLSSVIQNARPFGSSEIPSYPSMGAGNLETESIVMQMMNESVLRGGAPNMPRSLAPKTPISESIEEATNSKR